MLLVDAHERARRALSLLFERSHDFHLVGETADEREAVSLASEQRPTIVLLDIRRLSAPADLCRALLRASPTSKLVVQSTFYSQNETNLYGGLGVVVCLQKVQPFRQLALALYQLVRSPQ